jgi:hypothetical protein
VRALPGGKTVKFARMREPGSLTYLQVTLIEALTPPPGRGHRVFREEAALEAAVQRILETQGVTDLLTVTWETGRNRAGTLCRARARWTRSPDSAGGAGALSHHG